MVVVFTRNIPDSYTAQVSIGGNLRAIRVRLGWAQTYVSKRLVGDTSKQSELSKWERGGTIPIPMLLRLAVLYGVSLDQLLHGEDAEYDAAREADRGTQSAVPSHDAYTQLQARYRALEVEFDRAKTAIRDIGRAYAKAARVADVERKGEEATGTESDPRRGSGGTHRRNAPGAGVTKS